MSKVTFYLDVTKSHCPSSSLMNRGFKQSHTILMKKVMARELGGPEAGGEQLIVGRLSDWWQSTSLRGGDREEGPRRSDSSVGQWVILGITQWKDAAFADSAGREPQPAPE